MADSAKYFAIAMPIGHWHPLLPAALRSLAVQRRRPEIAVLNASNDPRVAQALDQSGLSFAYRRDAPDAGQASAIVEGWRRTDSEFVGWLNCDDLLLPGALDEAAAALSANPAAGGVYGLSVILNADRSVAGLQSAPGDMMPLMALSNPVSQPSCFLRRRAVDAVGGLDETLHYVMDWDLWLRLQEGGFALDAVESIWSAVFWGVGTKTSRMTARRVREVFNLTRPRVGAFNAAKTVGSMMLDGGLARHLFPFSSAARQGGAAKARDGVRVTAGAHPGERPRREAVLRIPNAFSTPRSRLEINTDCAALEVSAPGAAAQAAEGRWRLEFEAPVSPARDRTVTLSAPDGRAGRFLSARWLS